MDGAHRLLLITERIRELHGVAARERLARAAGAGASSSPSAIGDRSSPAAFVAALARRLARRPLSA